MQVFVFHKPVIKDFFSLVKKQHDFLKYYLSLNIIKQLLLCNLDNFNEV